MFFPLGRCTLYTKTKHQDQQMECQAASATHETLALEHAKQLCGKIEMLRTYCLPSTSRLYTCLYVRRYLTLPYLYLPCALGNVCSNAAGIFALDGTLNEKCQARKPDPQKTKQTAWTWMAVHFRQDAASFARWRQLQNKLTHCTPTQARQSSRSYNA